MKTAQEKQGYRVKSSQPVCGNCVHVSTAAVQVASHLCQLGIFPVDLIHGTCRYHEWRK